MRLKVPLDDLSGQNMQAQCVLQKTDRSWYRYAQKSGCFQRRLGGKPYVLNSSTFIYCPRCGSRNTCVSSRQSRKASLRAWFYKIYRCNDCSCHFKTFLSQRFLAVIALVLSLTFILTSAIYWLKPKNEIYQEEAIAPEIIDLAKQGNAEAALELGLHSKHRNPKESSEWLEKSAKRGNLEAKYHYGMALMEGNGVLQNYKDAIYWLQDAAMSGHDSAQYEMGNILDLGIGVLKDTQKAYMWFTLAAAKDVKDAVTRRDALSKSLSLEQILTMQEEAKKIASKDNSKHQP